ncbi:TetR/AcrR family transcriptional regulator [Actinobacteria bacterium YIM 96077]|uniref:TetR family transcriptional regulator n=1 Tax=Phytoactinopolyspora halophila TaxID=1981511 RepID=A0A329R0K1_9ACTN|nr:TetR/AcrR family transcriptional regulator [Phytoactinopolyspora halophila]AYY15167.1 TetR/AcrR family transcriptional regulator [Actinobacteria bacterium YIM 96077]RAW18160.1 TetR family transcriptional regulator [Phytoactinopolyspora halophila]
MTRQDGATAQAHGGLPDKRRAILAGARTVFADGGYTRASVEAIAAEAGVSTRTIYNHFHDKLHLFQAVITESTAEVADAQVALIDAHLRKVTDLEADLIELGQALAAPMTGHAEHFAEHVALVRHLLADSGHLPQDTIDAWRQAGPERVIGVLAGHLQQLADRGLLHIPDSHQAAAQFIMLLVHGVAPFHHSLGTTREADIHEIVTSGVRAFLHGYLA